MRNPLLVPDLRELIQSGEVVALREFIEDQHPGRTAELIEDLEAEDGDSLFRILLPRDRADVLSYLNTESQNRIVEAMPPQEAAELLHHMSHDERADLVNRLDEDFVDVVLPHLAHAEREDIRRLASYEPGTAGAVMTTDYVTLPAHITVREALDRLRHDAPDRETIYYCYVVDHNRRLIGFVSLKNLILSRRSALIEDIMQRDVIFGRLDDDQEAAARQIDKYDLLALPIVDSTGRLVGIITHDDAMDILRQEQTEDILKFGGVSADPEADTAPYWQSTVIDVVRRRIKWLLMLFVAENLTYPVLHYYGWMTDETHFPALDFFCRSCSARGVTPAARRLARSSAGWLWARSRDATPGRVLLRRVADRAVPGSDARYSRFPLCALLARPALERLHRGRTDASGHLHVGQYHRRLGAPAGPQGWASIRPSSPLHSSAPRLTPPDWSSISQPPS